MFVFWLLLHLAAAQSGPTTTQSGPALTPCSVSGNSPYVSQKDFFSSSTYKCVDGYTVVPEGTFVCLKGGTIFNASESYKCEPSNCLLNLTALEASKSNVNCKEELPHEGLAASAKSGGSFFIILTFFCLQELAF